MNTLTVNVHLMMVSFYRPTAQRFKILLEDHAFPSDHVRSCCLLALDSVHLLTVSSLPSSPRSGFMVTIRLLRWSLSNHEKARQRCVPRCICFVNVGCLCSLACCYQDILSAIREHGDTLALVMLSGVQYFTGQLFDIPTITKAGHEAVRCLMRS
jgi:kynureninase